MKYCPYCGAELVDGAASFCAECGKSLPSAAAKVPDDSGYEPADKMEPEQSGPSKPEGREEKQPVQKIAEKDQHHQPAEHTQFFTHNRKDHIVLGLRHRSQLLYAVSKSFAKKAAASNGVQGLHDLIAPFSPVLKFSVNR